ncbi:MAG: acyl-CoA dehydrogenase [Chloroflexi bacterium]|nr:acyl-CoA dehydrogenase [Chloroflexota bacterium]MYD17503.1 acyl-CoA dehydrogenase [Chloroflexota bacterium]MYJ00790.1 acyl-CoA dehydrogenase [Chloroflexota bacterium]
MSESLDLIVQAVRRFVRNEIWLQERRIDANAARLPDDVFDTLLARAGELGIDHLMAPRGASVGPQIDLPDGDRLRIAEELSQHRAGALNPAYGLFDPDPPPQLYAGDDDQRARLLEPLLRREASCFRGLEDPDLAFLPTDGVRIRAQRHPLGWMLDGTKLFVADAANADFGIVYCNTEETPGERSGISAIVVECDRVGFQRWRPWPTIATGRDTMELNLSAVKLPESNVLGEVNAGPAFANGLVLRRRLFTAAHLTGIASAAQDMCRGVVWSRREHGAPLAQGERARLALADNEIATSASRALYLSAAEELEEQALPALAFALDAANTVVDRAMQLHGPAGGSADLPLERWAREVRWLRLTAGGLDQQRQGIAERLLSTFKK